MRKAILQYSLQAILVSILLALSYFLFCEFGFPQFQTNAIYIVIISLFIINAGFHSYSVYTIHYKNEAFNRRFLASTMLKILIYLIIILIMIFTGQPNIKIILVAFLLFYIVYTIHEISSILQYLKKNSSQHIKSK